MSLSGNTAEEKVWNYLKGKGLSDYACAGFLGNFYAESGIIFNRVEILCLKRLRENGKGNYTDASYTQAVDNGSISRASFLNPLPGKQYGYGLWQLTSPGRKAGLYDLCKSRGVSIADPEAQMDYLWTELNGNYKHVLNGVKSATSVKAASDVVLTKFEIPANASALSATRASYSQKYYSKYAGKTVTANTATTTNTTTTEAKTMTSSEAIQAVINIAKGEVGYLEKRSNSNLDDKTANAGSANYTKYWRDVSPSLQAQPWCAAFVTWCFMKAFGQATAKKLLKHYPYTYVPTMASLFSLKSSPAVGDIVLFNRSGSTYTHTGLVIAVSGNNFTTIEGNTSGGSTIVANGGGVFQKTYNKSSLGATKYCTPDYSIVTSANSTASSSSSTSTTTSSSSTSRNWLQKGDTGSAVKTMQELLIKAGYSVGIDGADGDFGNNTRNAVLQFQRDNGLDVDGEYGVQSKAKLEAIVAQKSAQTTNTTPTTNSGSKGINKTVVRNGKVNSIAPLNVRTWAGAENPTVSFSPLPVGVTVGICDTIKANDGSNWHFIKYNNLYGFVDAQYIS